MFAYSVKHIATDDLRPGDIIVSRKKGKTFLQKTFNSLVEDVGERRYGDHGLYLRSNHVRLCIAPAEGTKPPTLFHWTWPKSETGRLHTWMLDPRYAFVCRPIFGIPANLFKLAKQQSGRWYNVGLLADIYLGMPFDLFSLGLSNEVCSTGAMDLISDSYHRRFIPADFLNRDEFFVRENFDTRISVFREEPDSAEEYYAHIGNR